MTQFGRPKILHWTSHAKAKMRHYRLSEQRVKHVIHAPKRIEKGIASKTVAMMQPSSIKQRGGKLMWTQEIWVMIQDKPQKRSVISAWRYPGMTKQGEPLPAEILRELRAMF